MPPLHPRWPKACSRSHEPALANAFVGCSDPERWARSGNAPRSFDRRRVALSLRERTVAAMAFGLLRQEVGAEQPNTIGAAFSPAENRPKMPAFKFRP
jgi:hypothetical protein